ncbi:AAA family ATPase [Amycolatopsis panacis]|nr:AAA family ATPase [Amycolatopsis panacis]
MAASSIRDVGHEEAGIVLEGLRAGPGAVWLVAGPAGSGRTTLLATTAQRYRRAGTAAIRISAAGAPRDPLRRLATTLRTLISTGALPGPAAVAATARLPERLAAGSGAAPLAVAHDLITAVAGIAAVGPVALLFDDLDAFAPEVATVLALLAEGVRGSGVLTIFTITDTALPAAATHRFRILADATITLREHTTEEITALLPVWTTGTGRTPTDQALVDALVTALGPLAGNLATVRQVVAELRDSGRLIVLDGHVCLTGRGPIALPRGHPLPAALRRLGPVAGRLATMIAGLDEHGAVGIDDLPAVAWALRLARTEAGQALDDLVRLGVLRISPSGRIRPAAPALGAALRQRHRPRWRGAVHRAFAELPGAPPSAASTGRRAELAWFLTESPDAQSGRDPDFFLTAATEAEATDRELACRYRIAALRRSAPGGPHWAWLIGEVVEAHFALGRYRRLAGELGTTVVPRLLAEIQYVPDKLLMMVTVCWLAVLTHEDRHADLDRATPLLTELARRGQLPGGEILPDAIRRADPRTVARLLAATGRVAGPLGTGCALLIGSSAADSPRLHAAWLDWTGSPLPAETSEAADRLDRAGALRSLLGKRYTLPKRGPAADYHHLLAAYRDGDWDAALSSARRMESDRRTRGTPASHPLAAVLAAEICAQREEPARAQDWLRNVPHTTATGSYLAWVWLGIRWQTEETDQALHQGRQDYLALHNTGCLPGMELLLSRLIAYATHLGDRTTATRALAELIPLSRRRRTAHVREATLVFGGMVRNDTAALTNGIRMARASGDTFRIAQACLAMGRLSPSPETWLLKAHRTLKRLGATREVATVTALLRARQIPVPRETHPRTELDRLDLRIAELVSRGHTNRQIAAALATNEKRIEARLTALFEQTGCAGRVDLTAAWLHGRLQPGPRKSRTVAV